MKLRDIVLLFILIFSGLTAYALPPVESIDNLYNNGEKRVYHFIMSDSAIGTLEVEYKGASKLEGIQGFQFREILDLDFSPLGQQYKVRIENRHYLKSNNIYLGDDMSMYINDQYQKLFFKYDGFELKGYTVKGSEDEDLSLPQRQNFMSLDNNLIDQIELYLATKELNVGDTVIDTVFVPQILLMSDVEFTVDSYDLIRYGDLYDSAYLCQFSRPTQMSAYITKEHKLIKMTQETQALEVYLYETPLEKMAPVKNTGSFGIGDFIKRLPLYLVYLVFGFICAFFPMRGNVQYRPSYMAMLLGALIYTLSFQTLFPFQKWYSMNYIIPGMQEGSSLYILGLLPSLVSGFILELLKLVPIAVLFVWQKPKQIYSVLIGLMAGIGFGVYGACSITGAGFQAGSISIISAPVIERLTAILFHAATGALLGYGINRSWKYLTAIWLTAFVIHAFSDYIILFVQSRTIDISILIVIKTLFALIAVLAGYVIIKRARNR